MNDLLYSKYTVLSLDVVDRHTERQFNVWKPKEQADIASLSTLKRPLFSHVALISTFSRSGGAKIRIIPENVQKSMIVLETSTIASPLF